MSFLAPLFFAALAALAIPVLLHLTQREKKQIVHFPSLMFVRRIPYQSVRRRKIQNWLLLMVRMAALALIILAFARPLLDRADVPTAGADAREVVFLVDTSYSMGFGNRWPEAQAAARDQINRLTASDRGSVVLFGSGADIQLRSTSERSRLAATVDSAAPSPSSTRFSPALKVAGSILADSTLPRREVVIISDFQRGGWRGEEGAKLPEGTTLTPVPIQSTANRGNLSVTGVTFSRTSFSDQQRIVVTAGVSNRTDQSVAGSTMTLEVGGISVGTKPVVVEPGTSGSVAFDAFTISGRNTRASVRLSEDALAADNSFNFVLSPIEPVHITVVDRGNAASGLYLTRVLSIGESPKFEAVFRQGDALSDEDLRRSAVVVLNDVEVGVPLARRLARYVEQGGGLFVATGSRARWPQEVDALPGTVGPPVDRTRGDAARVGALEYGHPVFEPFRAPRSGDFSSIPVYGYRNVTAAKDAQVLARFDAGTPAVLERRLGRGRVMLWASTLDVSWSDLPTKPVFLPFIHQSVRHLAGYTEPDPWLTVGQVLNASAGPARISDSPRVLLTPSGRRLPLDDEGSDVLELTEQGFYEIRGEANQTETVVAANVDPAEADLTPMDPREITAAAVGAGAEEQGAQNGVPLTPEAREKNQRLWWYLLIVGILVLGVDTLLSNRMAKA
ncbi:MAG TPA: BatA domain-containing protein [Vicinamibacterales bacterium]|nr:BatA domain-containing protein [Vicinamibacterales bacterium]